MNSSAWRARSAAVRLGLACSALMRPCASEAGSQHVAPGAPARSRIGIHALAAAGSVGIDVLPADETAGAIEPILDPRKLRRIGMVPAPLAAPDDEPGIDLHDFVLLRMAIRIDLQHGFCGEIDVD